MFNVWVIENSLGGHFWAAMWSSQNGTTYYLNLEDALTRMKALRGQSKDIQYRVKNRQIDGPIASVNGSPKIVGRKAGADR